jgi:hypothetical protein
MKRVVLLAVPALAALFVAGFALADAVTVSMTSTGPVPPTATVNWGGTVQFVNSDTIDHSLASSEPEIGTTTVPVGQTVSIVFSGKAGLKRYVMSGKPRAFFGPAVEVTLNGKLDLHARTGVVTYGQSVQLQGSQSLGPGAQVSIQQRPLNQFGNGSGDWHVVAGPISTSSSGRFSYGVTPAAGAEYQAVAAAGQLLSNTVLLFVQPRIDVHAPRRARVGRAVDLRVSVRPANAARSVDLEGYIPRLKRWHVIGRVSLSRAGAGGARLVVQAGTARMRFSIGSTAVAAGLRAGTSKVFTVVGVP